MRIALVTPSVLPFSCGNSLLAERLRTGLAGCGHETAVFSIYTDSAEKVLAFTPDIIHSLHAIKPAAWLESVFEKITPPWVITLTGTDYNSPEEYGGGQGMLARQFAGAAAIVVFHEEARSWVAGNFVDVAEKLHVIAQGIETYSSSADRLAVRQQYSVAPDEILFFMAAGIRPVKNISFALDLLAAVRRRHSNARLILAGPTVDTAEADHVLQKGRACEGFSFIGEIAHAAVRKIMAAADIYLNVSLHEGMSGSILEAMAEGLPVLASDAPGNRMLVQHGSTGLLHSLTEPGEFASAACRLIEDPQLRGSMRRSARLLAADFSVAAEIEKYENVYRKITYSAM